MRQNQSPSTQAYLTALRTISAMVERGEDAAAIAAYVVALGTDAPLGVAASVSRMIENSAAPGTVAERVFAILAE